jgi:hypothetical protein
MATEHGKRIAREYLQAVVDAIMDFDAPTCCDEAGTEWFALAAVLQALDVPCNFDNPTADLDDLDSVLGRVVRCARLEAVEIAGEPWPMISFPDLLAHVVPFGRAPAARACND